MAWPKKVPGSASTVTTNVYSNLKIYNVGMHGFWINEWVANNEHLKWVTLYLTFTQVMHVDYLICYFCSFFKIYIIKSFTQISFAYISINWSNKTKMNMQFQNSIVFHRFTKFQINSPPNKGLVNSIISLSLLFTLWMTYNFGSILLHTSLKRKYIYKWALLI